MQCGLVMHDLQTALANVLCVDGSGSQLTSTTISHPISINPHPSSSFPPVFPFSPLPLTYSKYPPAFCLYLFLIDCKQPQFYARDTTSYQTYSRKQENDNTKNIKSGLESWPGVNMDHTKSSPAKNISYGRIIHLIISGSSHDQNLLNPQKEIISFLGN